MAYFPNGTAGMKLQEQCWDCPIHDDQPCPILLVSLDYNYKQCDNEDLKASMDVQINEKGICMMKPLIEMAIKYPKTSAKPNLDDYVNPLHKPMKSMREWCEERGVNLA